MKRTPYAHILVLIVFIINTLGPLPQASADSAFGGAGEFHLPVPGVMVHLSPPFDPPILKGIKVHPDNPFLFDFILEKGDSSMSSPNASVGDLKSQSTKLIKYFLASLTIPEQDLWVNLSPYEKDRIIPQSFGLTEMGRDLLAEDYMLKQITASLIYPENEIGRKFWKRIYAEAFKRYGTTNIPVNTFNKVWIVPEKAVVYENVKAGTAYVVESRLKVMLEQDYLSIQKHECRGGPCVRPQNDVDFLGSQIIREIVIPELTKEVNEGKNFIQLRQVYNSLILATWYKKKIKDSILEKVYADRNKVAGIASSVSIFPIASKSNSLVSLRGRGPKQSFKTDTEYIYQQYLKAFKKGVYNYIKEDTDPVTQETTPRKYFSGGVVLNLYQKTSVASSRILQYIHQLGRGVKTTGLLIVLAGVSGLGIQNLRINQNLFLNNPLNSHSNAAMIMALDPVIGRDLGKDVFMMNSWMMWLELISNYDLKLMNTNGVLDIYNRKWKVANKRFEGSVFPAGMSGKLRRMYKENMDIIIKNNWPGGEYFRNNRRLLRQSIPFLTRKWCIWVDPYFTTTDKFVRLRDVIGHEMVHRELFRLDKKSKDELIGYVFKMVHKEKFNQLRMSMDFSYPGLGNYAKEDGKLRQPKVYTYEFITQLMYSSIFDLYKPLVQDALKDLEKKFPFLAGIRRKAHEDSIEISARALPVVSGSKDKETPAMVTKMSLPEIQAVWRKAAGTLKQKLLAASPIEISQEFRGLSNSRVIKFSDVYSHLTSSELEVLPESLQFRQVFGGDTKRQLFLLINTSGEIEGRLVINIINGVAFLSEFRVFQTDQGRGTVFLSTVMQWLKEQGRDKVVWDSDISAVGFYHRFLTPRVDYEANKKRKFIAYLSTWNALSEQAKHIQAEYLMKLKAREAQVRAALLTMEKAGGFFIVTNWYGLDSQSRWIRYDQQKGAWEFLGEHGGGSLRALIANTLPFEKLLAELSYLSGVGIRRLGKKDGMDEVILDSTKLGPKFRAMPGNFAMASLLTGLDFPATFPRILPYQFPTVGVKIPIVFPGNVHEKVTEIKISNPYGIDTREGYERPEAQLMPAGIDVKIQPPTPDEIEKLWEDFLGVKRTDRAMSEVGEITLGVTRKNRNNTIDAFIAGYLKRKGIKKGVVVDLGTGFPPVTTVHLAQTLGAEHQVIGLDLNMPNYTLEFSDPSGRQYTAFFEIQNPKGISVPQLRFIEERLPATEGEYSYNELPAADRERLTSLAIERNNVMLGIKGGGAFDYSKTGDIPQASNGDRFDFNPIHRWETQAPENLSFRKGGFEMGSVTEQVDIIRVMNTMGSYTPKNFRDDVDMMGWGLKEGGIIIIGGNDDSVVFTKENGRMKATELLTCLEIEHTLPSGTHWNIFENEKKSRNEWSLMPGFLPEHAQIITRFNGVLKDIVKQSDDLKINYLSQRENGKVDQDHLIQSLFERMKSSLPKDAHIDEYKYIHVNLDARLPKDLELVRNFHVEASGQNSVVYEYNMALGRILDKWDSLGLSWQEWLSILHLYILNQSLMVNNRGLLRKFTEVFQRIAEHELDLVPHARVDMLRRITALHLYFHTDDEMGQKNNEALEITNSLIHFLVQKDLRLIDRSLLESIAREHGISKPDLDLVSLPGVKAQYALEDDGQKMEDVPLVKDLEANAPHLHSLLFEEQNLSQFLSYATFMRHFIDPRLFKDGVRMNLQFALDKGVYFPLGKDVYFTPITGSFRRFVIFEGKEVGGKMIVSSSVEIKVPGLLPHKQKLTPNSFKIEHQMRETFTDVIMTERQIATLKITKPLNLWGRMFNFSESQPCPVIIAQYDEDSVRLDDADLKALSLSSSFYDEIVKRYGETLRVLMSSASKEKGEQFLGALKITADQNFHKDIIRQITELIAKLNVLGLDPAGDGGIRNLRISMKQGRPVISLAADFQGYKHNRNQDSFIKELRGNIIELEGDLNEASVYFDAMKAYFLSRVSELQAVVRAKTGAGNPAMGAFTKANTGGIDFATTHGILQSKSVGINMKIYLDSAMLKQLQNAQGFVPVIYSIQPMTDLRGFLGLKDHQNIQSA